MNPAILSATAALVGSLVGGVSTLAAYWLTQRVQLRAQSLMKRHAEREALEPHAKICVMPSAGMTTRRSGSVVMRLRALSMSKANALTARLPAYR